MNNARIRWTTITLGMLSGVTAASQGQGTGASVTTICIAPPAAQMASGSNVDAANALRDLFAAYLSGPTIAAKPLTARLPSQAREEAKQASCKFVLFASMKLERNEGNGALGRIVGGAVQSGAGELRGAATSKAARIAANAAVSAANEAARGLATNVKSKDQLTLDYHLDAIDGRSIVQKTEKAKAQSDGQDLLTPIVERAAEVVATTAGDTKTADGEVSRITSSSSAPTATGNIPNACTFFSHAELESAVGWQLRAGKAKDAPPGTFECSFEKPQDMYITKTYPNPPIPKSADFTSLTVHTHPVDPKRFAEFRKNLGAAAEDVPGIGDGAYFYGPNLLYVRVGESGFSLRTYTSATSAADKARVREATLSLAKLGASKLRGK
jgi:hypothetical protein